MEEPRIDLEQMGGHFAKYHLRGPWPFHPVIHRFTAPDRGDPHDHPWSFRSMILHGGYREEVYSPDGGYVRTIDRKPGDSFLIEAGHIHRIVDLGAAECFTLILPQASERVSGFYRWDGDGKCFHRFWHESDWRVYDPNLFQK